MKIQTIEKLFNKRALIDREISDLTAETILEMLRDKWAHNPADPAINYFTIRGQVGTLDERIKPYVDCAITSLLSANKIGKTIHSTIGAVFEDEDFEDVTTFVYYLKEEKK